jgi:hypothetical protein
MQRLVIELYLEEDVDVLIAQLVRARGFATLTTRDAGNRHLSDDEQLAYATAHGMAFLTHDRVHFEIIHQAYVTAEREHAGLIIAVRRSPYELARRLLLILNNVTADEMDNQLRYIRTWASPRAFELWTRLVRGGLRSAELRLDEVLRGTPK